MAAFGRVCWTPEMNRILSALSAAALLFYMLAGGFSAFVMKRLHELPDYWNKFAGGPLSPDAFESDLRREGFQVIYGGQKADFAEDLHAHPGETLLGHAIGDGSSNGTGLGGEWCSGESKECENRTNVST